MLKKSLLFFMVSLFIIVVHQQHSMASKQPIYDFDSNHEYQSEDLSPDEFFCQHQDISKTEIDLYFKKLGERYNHIKEDLLGWIHAQGENVGKNVVLDVDMKYLWRSYQRCPNFYSQWLAGYGRVWTYDASLGMYSIMVENDFNRAKLAAENFMDIIRAEKKKGYRGLFHFSYNTNGDDFIDPREPQGATQWVLKVLYTYMLETGDLSFFNELTLYVQRDVLPLQILAPDYPAYGLLRQGYAHPDGLSQGGYHIYENIDELNQVSHRVNLEHNADFIDLLRLMAMVYDTYKDRLSSFVDDSFRDELRKRHALAMQAVRRLRKDAHFPTAFDEEGNANWSRAIDHYTWLSHTFIDVKNNDDIPWDSIKILYDEFSTVIDSVAIMERLREVRVPLPQKAKGIYFFQRTFGDCFVSIGPEEREKLEEMIQPEATAGALCMLMDFIRHTDNPHRRRFALTFLYELCEGLALVHQTYNQIKRYDGGGMPYATEFILDYFGPDPAVAASATYHIALSKLQEDYKLFLGVPCPSGFENACIEEVDPKTLPESIPLPSHLLEKREVSEIITAADAIAQLVKFKDVLVKDGKLFLNIEYPTELFHDLELIIMKKTDVWYVQPRSIGYMSAGQRLPRSGVLKYVKTFKDELDKNTLVIVARRGHGLRHDASLLQVEMKAFYENGDFITMSSVDEKNTPIRQQTYQTTFVANRSAKKNKSNSQNKLYFCTSSLTDSIRQECLYRE